VKTKRYKVPMLGLRLVRERTMSIPTAIATCNADIAAIATAIIGDRPTEHLIAIMLDARSNVTAVVTLAQGGMSSCSVRPSDVLRAVLVHQAAAFILSHNHPSGDPTPSREDIALTDAVREAAKAVCVPMVDHVIVTAKGDFASCP
jgi:DNA repair protein RadC